MAEVTPNSSTKTKNKMISKIREPSCLSLATFLINKLIYISSLNNVDEISKIIENESSEN